MKRDEIYGFSNRNGNTIVRVIQTYHSIAPEAGGTARAVTSLCSALAQCGVDVNLLTHEIGQGYSPPIMPRDPKVRVTFSKYISLFGVQFPSKSSYKTALRLISPNYNNTVLHDNGMWLPEHGIIAKMSKTYKLPLIVTSHGMLEPWALKNKKIKKRISWYTFQHRWLSGAQVLHATCKREALNLRALGLNQPIALIPNGVLLPTLPNRDSSNDARVERSILFLSRIHPVKGLFNLVEAVKRLSLDNWRVIIAGYDENGHQAEVERAVQLAGLERVIKFHGPVGDTDKWDLYQKADIFVLPSYSENFGIVVAEALASGVPVITTKGTPWHDLVAHKCGWWVDPTVEALTAALYEAVNITDETRISMGERGRELVKTKYAWEAIGADMASVYHWMLFGGTTPSCIMI